MADDQTYQSSIEIKESGTNQKPALHVTVSSTDDKGSIDMVAKALRDYMVMIRAIRPDDVNAKAYIDAHVKVE